MSHHEPIVPLEPMEPMDPSGQHSGHAEHSHNGPLVILFIAFGLLLGGILREINKKTKMPYTPMLLLLGILLGYCRHSLGVFGQSTSIIQKLNPHMILLIFIPVLIFESAFNCQWHVFRKSLINIITLAGPGVLWGAILIAICFKWILMYPDDQLNWYQALTLGCVLSATDPVAVVALLKELGASVRFNTLVQGQSLMNDGTAMVFFTLFLNLAKGESTTAFGVVASFVRIALGGPVLGLIVGFLISYWMKRIIRDPVLSINITFVGAYLCFYIAQFTWVKVSGILAIVVLGLYMSAVGKRKIYPQSQHALHNVWAYIQYACQTLIFILTGVVVGTQMIEQSTITLLDWFRMFVFWFLMIGMRTIMVLTVYPILKRTGYGLTRKQMVVLIYGGLRGALGLCLSLIVGVDDDLDVRFREITVFYMCGMAMLTIIVNGLTCGKVVNYVQMISYPQIKRKLLKRCVKDVLASTQKKLKQLKSQPSVAYARWKEVQQLAQVKVLGQTSHQRRSTHVQISQHDIRDSLNDISKTQMVGQIRFRLTRYLNKLYWQFYQHGQLTEESIEILSKSCDIVNDNVNVPLRYFQVLSGNFTRQSMSYYLKIKQFPLIGGYVTRLLINRLYQAYQISQAFIEAGQQAIHVFQHSFPLNTQHLNHVLNQLKDNIQQSVNYVAQLQNNYPSLIKAVHTAKASITIIKHKKHMLKQMYEQGFVDETDYSLLRKQIDQSLVNVDIHNFQLTEVKFNQVLTQCPLFSNLPTDKLVEIFRTSRDRVFTKNTTIQVKKEIKNVYFIISGTVKQQFDGFYFMKGIGNVINPYNFVYDQVSKATVKSVTDTKVMEIDQKVIRKLLNENAQFRKKWYKSIFPYCLKTSRGSDLIQKQFTTRQLRRFIQGSQVMFLEANQIVKSEHGAYVFEGQIESDGSLYTRGNFLSQDKVLKARVQSVILKFEDIVGLKIQDQRISHVNQRMDD